MPTTAETARSLKQLIATISAYPDIQARAENEAERLIFRLALRHPLTHAAAMRIVSENTNFAEFKLVAATAAQLVSRVSMRNARRHVPPLT